MKVLQESGQETRKLRGKIEYHSNRFYIDAGSTSARIVEFRCRGGTNSYIDNIGRFYGSADLSYLRYKTSSRWSDVREKKDIESMNSSESLDNVMRMNPVSFKWKKGNETELGFIAQEIQEIVPELVQEAPSPAGKNGKSVNRLSVDYEEIIPILTSAIQEQQKQINELKKQIKKS